MAVQHCLNFPIITALSSRLFLAAALLLSPVVAEGADDDNRHLTRFSRPGTPDSDSGEEPPRVPVVLNPATMTNAQILLTYALDERGHTLLPFLLKASGKFPRQDHTSQTYESQTYEDYMQSLKPYLGNFVEERRQILIKTMQGRGNFPSELAFIMSKVFEWFPVPSLLPFFHASKLKPQQIPVPHNDSSYDFGYSAGMTACLAHAIDELHRKVPPLMTLLRFLT